MRGVKTILALSVVGILLALVFVQVDVPSLNSHEGAVAYAKPILKVETAATTATVGDKATLGTGGSLSTVPMKLEVTPLRYTAPAPTTSSLLDRLLPSTISLQPAPTDPSLTDPGSCTSPTITNEDVTLKIPLQAKVTISEPGSTMTTWESAKMEFVLKTEKITTTCQGRQAYVFYSIKEGASMSFDMGTYYFTKGFGDYQFKVEIYGNADQVLVGSSSLRVSLTPESI